MNLTQLNLFDNNIDDQSKIYDKDKYLVTDCNKSLLEYLLNVENWTMDKFTLISGSRFSGKTHLANISARANQGMIINLNSCNILNNFDLMRDIKYIIIDEIDSFPEEVIFHLFNYLRTNNKFALFITKLDLSQIILPDLKSRLTSIPLFNINHIDELLLRGVLIKILSDFQLSIDNKILDFIAKNLDKSFKMIHKLIEAIKLYVYDQKSKITIIQIKKIIEDLTLEKFELE